MAIKIQTMFSPIFLFTLALLCQYHFTATDGVHLSSTNTYSSISASEKVVSGSYPLNSTTSYTITSNISASTYYWEFLGSSDCYPVISCPLFFLKESYLCLYDFMTLSDGSSDVGMKLCGTNGPKYTLSQTTILIVNSRIFQTFGYYSVTHSQFACSVSCASSPLLSLATQANGNANTGFTQTSSYKPSITWIPNTPLTTTNCDCGIRGPFVNESPVSNVNEDGDATTLIVGGNLAKIGEYRMQIAMVQRIDNDLRCGGTLLNNKFVLTAAHCCLDDNELVIDPAKYAVLLNTFDISDLALTHGLKENIIRIIVHPLFSTKTVDYDACVLEMEHAVDIVSPNEPILRTACLPPPRFNDQFVGSNVTVTGWGDTSEGGGISTKLLEVDVTVISNTQCNVEYDGSITDVMLCAESIGKDSCQGDSGGPAFKEVYDRYMQVGVVSFGQGCARPGFAGVYSRVTVLSDWIRMTGREGVWCRGLENFGSISQHYGAVVPRTVAVTNYLSTVYTIRADRKPVQYVNING